MSFHNFNLAFKQPRTTKAPYIAGDVFTRGRKELTLCQVTDGAYVGLLNIKGVLRMKAFNDLSSILDEGFSPVEEFIEKGKEIEEYDLYAPRKLKDGEWSALGQLAFTTAIQIGFDDLTPYKTRYCFGHNSVFPSHITALYWQSRLTSQKSVPIGNCAFRGALGSDPILSKETTKAYYAKMFDLKYNTMLIDGMDMHGIARQAMDELLIELIA